MVAKRQVAKFLGGEVLDVDITKINAATFQEIYQVFLDHSVLVIRGQKLEIPQWLDFCGGFGRLQPHINRSRRHPEFPNLLMLDNLAVNGQAANMRMVKGGVGWHSDLAYEKVPAKATGLYSVHIPSSGGDTLFNSMYAAYDALPEQLKSRLRGKQGIYNYGGVTKKNLALLDKSEHHRPPALHDLFQVHPETGRTALYFSTTQILGIADVSPEESAELVAELMPYVIKPEDYRHKWQVGDIVIWDNRCVAHSATGDYPLNERRLHWRTTIMAHDAPLKQAMSA